MTRFLNIFSVLLGTAALASGSTNYTNTVENGTTQTVDSEWTTSSIAVGGSSSSNTLALISGARVTNTTTQVGGSTIADENAVRVGSDAIWNMTGDLTVGDMGSDNSFEISAGGLVSNNAAFVGVDALASNNVVNVTGSGSRWDNAGAITIDGVSNTVGVSSGGTISTADLVISPGDGNTFNLQSGGTLNVTGDYNADTQTNVKWDSGGALEVNGKLTMEGGLTEEGRILTVSGSNTASWTVSSSVVSGTNNVVNISNGADLVSTNGTVSGGKNSVSVSGSGSTWENDGALGVSGSGNAVTVSGGGNVSADSVNIVDGNEFTIDSGGTLAITSGIDWLTTRNVNWESGGTLSVEGTLSGMETTDLVFDGTETNAVYLGSGRHLALNNGEWLNGNTNLVVGYNTSSASMAITNGSKVVNADGYIGWGATSGGNAVTISDTNSVWSNTGGNLYLGAYWDDDANLAKTGSGNLLKVNDDAQVFVGEVTNNTPGMLVASTNGAQFTIWNGSAFIEDTLQLGVSPSATGSATIKSGGYLSVGDLVIDAHTNSVLDLQAGGVFDIRTNFNLAAFEADGFSWGSNSTLSVGGKFTNTTNALHKGQDLVLNGSNAVWDISGEDLEIGLDGASVLTLINGATMTNKNTYIGANTNSGSHGVALNSGASWQANGDLYIGQNTGGNYLKLSGGSTNQLTGSAYIGGTNTSGNYAQIQGSNTLWAIGGDLLVGTNGSGSELRIYDQATVAVTSNLTVSAGNEIGFQTDGLLTVGGDVLLQSNTVVSGAGTIQFTDTDAALRLVNGNGNLSSSVVFEGAGNNTVDVDGGVFYVIGSNTNQYRNFETLDLTDTTLYGYGTNDAFEAVTMTGGIIAPSDIIGQDGVGTLVIDGTFTSSDTTYIAKVAGDEGSDLLHFTGAVDLTGLVAQVTVEQVNADETVILSSDGVMANNFASNNIINHLLLFDADLEVDYAAKQVKLVVAENGEKFSSSLDYAASESVRAGFNGMKNAVFTRTKQLRRNLVSTAHSIPHEAFLMSNTNAPAGAQGPGQDNTIFDMHVWMQFYNGQGTFDAQGNSYGFKLNNNGTTIGADRLIGEDLTVGFNYTYARGDAQTSNQDNLDSETYWLGAYGEWVGQNGFYVDTLAAFGWSNYDSVRVEQDASGRDYRGTASYKGNEFGGYADVGQYYYYKNLALSPYAGLHLLTLNTDEHTESNANSDSELTVHEQSRTILESALGMKARYRFDTGAGRFQVSGFAEWTHDFLQEDIYSTLSAEGTVGQNFAPVDMARITPESDVANTGLGFSWICTDYMEIGVGYNGRFSKNYEEHSGSLMLDIMF